VFLEQDGASTTHTTAAVHRAVLFTHLNVCPSLGASSSLARQFSAAVSGLPAYEPRISSGLHRYLPFLETRPANLPAYSIIFCEVVAIYGVVRLPPLFPIFLEPVFSSFLSDNRDRVLGKACPH
jgi:hypothetical protein